VRGRRALALAVASALLAALGLLLFRDDSPAAPRLTAAELRQLRSLSVDALQPADDPSNRYARDPDAAALGKQLFSDQRLSANGEVSCSTCHVPEKNFQDGRPRGRGIAGTPRRTMSLVGAARQTWFFWDGRRDSLWSQALEPLETPAEHGLTRAEVVHFVARLYGDEYRRVFGEAPRGVNRAFANVGKAIAAFETTIPVPETHLDRVARGNERFTTRELEGFRLFVGRAHCVDCHNGALLTNGEFHNTGVPQDGRDRGRAAALAKLRASRFTCLGPFSDADPNECALAFVARGRRLEGAFKPPSLRGVAENAPYMHTGEFTTLRDVLTHYNEAPRASVGRTEIHALHLTERDLEALEAFLRTLSRS
jgi:cytochrome c peroxidase